MPELPEVEVARRGILPLIQGSRITGTLIRTPRLRHDIAADLPRCLRGRRVTAIVRRGKYLLFRCDDGTTAGWLILHLGMSGSLRWLAAADLADSPPGRHDHVDIEFSAGILRFSDPRRFGTVLWHAGADVDRHPLLAGLGIEPFAAEFDGRWLHAAFSGRSAPVKTVLMDAHTIVGVGNIYASESLFRAAISPLRAARRISAARCERLAAAIRDTLTDAIAAGGSSIRDYLHADGGAGCFQIECAVYERAGESCRRCHGTVRQIRQAGRSTYYCPQCQH